MTRTRRRLLGLLAAALLALPWAAPLAASASAQPRYVRSEPSPGETLHHAPERVRIEFSEPLDGSSEIRVADECGRRVDAGDTRVDLNEMRVTLRLKPSGTYVVRYEATGIAGITGTTTGSFRFEVHLGPSCDGRAPRHDHNGGGGPPDHDGHRDRNGGHDRHDGGRDHDGGHTTGDHAAGRHATDDHAAGAHRDHDRHRGRDHDDHDGPGHEDHHPSDDAGEQRDLEPLALGPGGTPADGEAVLVGLGLAMALGVLGGWFLRISSA